MKTSFKRINRFLFFFLLILTPLLTINLYAGKNRIWTDLEHKAKFERISVEHGLSQNSVLCVCQDSKGFIWFGTEDGLNKYDGYSFKIFKPDLENPHSLSNSEVFSIFEDSKGILWIGTNGGGLNIFDQKKGQFIHFRNNPEDPKSISADDVNCIYEDRSGMIWIGTAGGGLNKLVPGTDTKTPPTFIRYLPDPKDPNSLSNDQVTSIHEDQRGTLWIGTDGGGLNRFDREKNRFTPFKYAANNSYLVGLNRTMAINEDRFGMLWIGTQSGLYRLNTQNETFTRFTANPRNPKSLSHNYIREIYKDRVGLLWIGTDGGGLNKLVPGKTKNSPPTFIHYRADPNDPNSLSNNAVEAIYEDRTGILWVGIYYGGVNKLLLRDTKDVYREKQQFLHFKADINNPNALSNNLVNAIAADRSGDLWVGTDGGGLNKIVPGKNKNTELKFVHYKNDPKNPKSLNDNIVTTLYVDRTGTLWIGTFTGGLNKMIPGEKGSSPTFVHYKHIQKNPDSLASNFVLSIFEDHLGVLWVGTIDGGLDKFDQKRKTFTHIPLNDNNVFSIYEDRSHNLWVGTVEGLNRYDREKDRFVLYQNDRKNPKSISANYIRTIYQDQAGVIWIGTNGGGLNKLVKGENWDSPPTFIHYHEKDGLPNNTILGILEDDTGNLWLSTNRGLSKFNPKTENFKNYDRRDGLQSDEFSRGAYYKNEAGEMFFGGSNGFNIFHPEDIKENLHIPPIVITDFQRFNKSVPIGELTDKRAILKQSITETDEIELSYKDNVFSFEFAALHFVNPLKNRYAYKMEGLEKEWNYVGNRRFVTYTTLPHGDYVFRVKGSNNDGMWNEEGVSLKIKITPPFTKTIWFYLLCALLIILSGVSIYRFRVRQLKKRQVELKQLVDQKTHQLEEANQKLGEANKELKRLATMDGLTGIANIRRFFEFYEREWRRSIRNATPISIILIDVDFFKLYNDTYGHQAGDECLKNIAKTLNELANRPGDLAARYGGEEFIIVLSETGGEGATIMAEKARAKVEKLGMVHRESNISEIVTISLGCATAIPGKDDNSELLVKKADDALYESKQKGRNQTTVSS